jgi:starch synthase
VGILNGIDDRSWDPAADPTLPKRFSIRRLRARAACRAELIAAAGIDDGVVLGNVGRMSFQKGLDLLEPLLAPAIEAGVRLVLVGNGELDLAVDEWVQAHPGMVAHLPYSEPLARLVSAGVDAYLMPSAFEPSGLGQLYAMRYGAPPIVHFVGGLADSVVDLDEDPDEATGFGFRSFTPDALESAIGRAITTYAERPRVWRALQVRGMTRDWSWDARAAEYEDVYVRAAAGG